MLSSVASKSSPKSYRYHVSIARLLVHIMADERTAVTNFSETDEMTVTEIAEQLGLNTATVRAWVHQGLVNARRDGRRWMIRRSAIDELLANQPTLGKPHSARRRETVLLGERPAAAPREGTRRYAAGILKNGLPL